ncbi:hypothetical protein DID80_04060 [Candidatus Marinamargulisbacteria bacterium SCGC AAA071-K20]|nr:hypothetical protein DID80_04060 [Candidatus Marinamargulisbacteria bacterium SCGC AAA071-K20]
MGSMLGLQPSPVSFVSNSKGQRHKSTSLALIVGKRRSRPSSEVLSGKLNRVLIGNTAPTKVRILENLLGQVEYRMDFHNKGVSSQHKNRLEVYSNLAALIKGQLTDLDVTGVGQFFDQASYVDLRFKSINIPVVDEAFVLKACNDDGAMDWAKYVQGGAMLEPNKQTLTATLNEGFGKNLTRMLQTISQLRLSKFQRLQIFDDLNQRVKTLEADANSGRSASRGKTVVHNYMCDYVSTILQKERANLEAADTTVAEVAAGAHLCTATVVNSSSSFPMPRLVSAVKSTYAAFAVRADVVAMHGVAEADVRKMNAVNDTIDELLMGKLVSDFNSLITNKVDLNDSKFTHTYFLNMVRVLKSPAHTPHMAALKAAALFTMFSSEKFSSVDLPKALAEVGRRGVLSEKGLSLENNDLLFALEILGDYLNQNKLMSTSSAMTIPNDMYIRLQHFFKQLSTLSESGLLIRREDDMHEYSEKAWHGMSSNTLRGHLEVDIKAINPLHSKQAGKNAAQSWLYQLTSHLGLESGSDVHFMMGVRSIRHSESFITRLLSSFLHSQTANLESFYDHSDYDNESLNPAKIVERIHNVLSNIPFSEDAKENVRSLLPSIFEMGAKVSVCDSLLNLHSNSNPVFNNDLILALVDVFLEQYKSGSFDDKTDQLGRILNRLNKLTNLLADDEKEQTLSLLNQSVSPSAELLVFENEDSEKSLLKFFLEPRISTRSSVAQLMFDQNTGGAIVLSVGNLWLDIIKHDDDLAVRYFNVLVPKLSGESTSYFKDFLTTNAQRPDVALFFSTHFLDKWMGVFGDVSMTSPGPTAKSDEREASFINKVTTRVSTVFSWINSFVPGLFKEGSSDSSVVNYLKGDSDKEIGFEKLDGLTFARSLAVFSSSEVNSEFNYEPTEVQGRVFDAAAYLEIENQVLEGKDPVEAMGVLTRDTDTSSRTIEQFEYTRQLFLNTYILSRAQKLVKEGYSDSNIHKFSIVSPGKMFSSNFFATKVLDIKNGHSVNLGLVADIVHKKHDYPVMRNFQLLLQNTIVIDLLNDCLELGRQGKLSPRDKLLLTDKMDSLKTELSAIFNKERLYEGTQKVLEAAPQFFMSPRAFSAKETLRNIIKMQAKAGSSITVADPATYNRLFGSLKRDDERRVFMVDVISANGIEKGTAIISSILNSIFDKDDLGSVNLHLDYMESLVKLLYPVSSRADSVKTHLKELYEKLSNVVADASSKSVTKYAKGLEDRFTNTWIHPVFQDFVGTDPALIYICVNWTIFNFYL